MLRPLSNIRRRVDQLTMTAALMGCGGHHRRYRIVDVHDDEPVPAWPASESDERCSCGAIFRYFTIVDEFRAGGYDHVATTIEYSAEG